MPTLSNIDALRTNGVPGLFSPAAFDVAWTQYHQYLVDQVNQMTAGRLPCSIADTHAAARSPINGCFIGTPSENGEMSSLVVNFARDPMKADLFNYASMAWNNAFFFQGINTNPSVASTPSSDLVRAINDSMTSFESFREEFLATAEAMFGPGFVWLVQLKEGKKELKILTTYLAGSPLSGAHYRRQSHDNNTRAEDPNAATNKVGSFGEKSAAGQISMSKPKKPLGGVDLTPLLCVNTWQHVWLGQYGIRGKRDYLNAWWDHIDWEQVRQYATLGSRTREQRKFQDG